MAARLNMIEAHIFEVLKEIDPRPEREGLSGTPNRVAESLKFLTRGHQVNLDKLFEQALFQSDEKEIIVIQNIEFYSMCEHHLLPFFGKCHIAYIPNGQIVGLSKFGDVLETFARRLQVQENLTENIAMCIQKYVNPKGVAVIIEAKHLCMMMRGIEKQEAIFKTQKFLGELCLPEKQQLFFNLLSQK